MNDPKFPVPRTMLCNPLIARKVLGWATSLIPPFCGIWLWYLWWAEPDEWGYLGKLIRWMEDRPLPSRRGGYLVEAEWETPWGRLILWDKGGNVSLHSEDRCLVCGFGGGVLGKRRVSRLQQLCEEAL